jgi:hypothetical protein
MSGRVNSVSNVKASEFLSRLRIKNSKESQKKFAEARISGTFAGREARWCKCS